MLIFLILGVRTSPRFFRFTYYGWKLCEREESILREMSDPNSDNSKTQAPTPVRRSSRQPVTSNRFNNGDFICEIRPPPKTPKPKQQPQTSKVKDQVEKPIVNEEKSNTETTEAESEKVRRRNEDAQLLLLLSSTDKSPEAKEANESKSEEVKEEKPVVEVKPVRKNRRASKDVGSEVSVVKEPPSVPSLNIPSGLNDSIASAGSPFTPSMMVGSPATGVEASGKRRRIMSIVAREAAETEAELREAKKRKIEEKLLNKQKTLEKQVSTELAKSTKKKPKSKSEGAVKSGKKRTSQQGGKQSEMTEKELKKLKKKKKKEKKRRRLFEEFERLIETSQINVEMIEKELEERKSQKLLKKMFKMQQKFQRDQLAQQQTQQIFFPAITPFDWFNQPSPLPSPAIKPPTQTPLPNKNDSQSLSTLSISSQSAIAAVPVRSNEPICCTVPNCNKQFRKPALLAYHLKYHHYLGQENQQPKSPQTKTTQDITRRDSKDGVVAVMENDQDEDQATKIESSSEDEENTEDDPYEVIHCSCGKNINTGGFMIQCECCLCWQHGDCEKLSSEQQVPDSYLCWLCSQANNQLKKLKYQSWMQSHKSVLDKHERSLKRKMRRKQTDSIVDDKQLERDRLNAINVCSKIYYEISLISYTIEYQMSLVQKIVQKGKKALAERSQQNSGCLDANNSINQTLLTTTKVSASAQLISSIDQAERLNSNVKHLQRCLADKTDILNKKLDGKFFKKIS